MSLLARNTLLQQALFSPDFPDRAGSWNNEKEQVLICTLRQCSGYYSEELETFVEIPSDNCQFNEKPHMKAKEITAAGKEALASGKFQMVRVNYANPGVLSHSSNALQS